MQWAIADDFFKVAIKIRQVLARKQVGKLGRMHVAGSLAGLQLMLEGLDCFRRARMAIFLRTYVHITEWMVSHLKLQNSKLDLSATPHFGLHLQRLSHSLWALYPTSCNILATLSLSHGQS